jgi:hypothetical protein
VSCAYVYLCVRLQHGRPVIRVASILAKVLYLLLQQSRTCVDGQSESESESLRFEAWWWLVTRPLLHQAGSRVRTPGLDNLKWDWHASQGCLQTPDPSSKSSKNVACGAAGAPRLMMNASCSFGPGSWILDGLYVSCKRFLIRAVRQRLLFFFPRPSPLSRCPDRRQARWHAPDHLTLLVHFGVSGAARLR